MLVIGNYNSLSRPVFLKFMRGSQVQLVEENISHNYSF